MLLPFREEPTMAENSFVTGEDVEFAENQCRKKRVPYVLANSVRSAEREKVHARHGNRPQFLLLVLHSVSKPKT